MGSLFFPTSNLEVPVVHYWLKCSKRVLSKAVRILLRLEKHGNGFLGETLEILQLEANKGRTARHFFK